MGEDFLPEVYREMSISETIEEYQNKFLVPVIHSRDEIQWMIDFVRKTLKGIKFRHLQSLNKKDMEKLKEYRKERREQLDILRICEQNIKQDTNTLLNAIAGSTNYEWDKNLLTKIVGFETKGISSSDNLIPLPILSLLYTLSSMYCLLVKCAINAMVLKYETAALYKNPNIDFFKEIREIKEMLAGKEKVVPNNQAFLAKHIRAGFKEYCTEHNNSIPDWLKAPSIDTLVKMFNHWNRYRKASEDQRDGMKQFEPYPRYEKILFESEKHVENWGKTVFAPTYINDKTNKKKEKEEKRRMSGKKKPDALERKKIGGEDAESLMDLLSAKEDPGFYFDEPNE